ncbi:hypothetical protein ACFP3Q_11590 [Nocardioides sp. GCM10027113]|uniref:hypothetical protein n=1 Tax=unclassified Nocardioides TaxID=2615069 RepID=UPI003606BF40
MSGFDWTLLVALLLIAGLVLLSTGLLGPARRARRASARLGNRRILTSDDVVLVEGNAHFPLDAG